MRQTVDHVFLLWSNRTVRFVQFVARPPIALAAATLLACQLARSGHSPFPRNQAMFRELAVVAVRALNTPIRHVLGTHGICRQPRIDDIATVVAVLAPTRYSVECTSSSGGTFWLADFDFEELVEFPDGWSFELHEVSSGVYTATGRGPHQETVESTDSDPDKVLADCRVFALRQNSR